MRSPSAYLCSYPKGGRTWMRFALANLMNELYGLNYRFNLDNMFSLIPNDDQSRTQPWKEIDHYGFAEYKEMPLIAMTHGQWDQRFASPPVVLLLRNPADMLVSRFYHLTLHQERFDGDINEFARSERWGVPTMVSYFRSWFPHVEDTNVCVETYEQLRMDPLPVFSRIASQLGIKASRDQLEDALSKSTVDKMKALEVSEGVGEPNRYDRSNPQARRVRRAKVGGWKEELPADTFDYLMDSITQSPEAVSLLERFDIYPT